jgi:hypothetical protein
MENTYTFTARSVTNPLRVATFTLHGDRMSIGMGSPIEQMESLIGDEDESEDTVGSVDVIQSQTPWIRPLIISLIERRSTPFHIGDVEAHRTNGGLHVQAWSRLAGLRFFPVIMRWDEVDNPAAADDFAREVNARQEMYPEIRKFIGFLDYWVSWVIGIISLIVLIGRQRGRRS